MLETTVQMYEQWEEQNPKLAHPQLAALLKWAAMLHEVGLNINHSGMHRHSAYILQNSDLPGFNQEQQMLMATLVRFHRKAIKLDELPRFTLFKKKQFLPLIQLLRLGVLLNNQRQAHHAAHAEAENRRPSLDAELPARLVQPERAGPAGSGTGAGLLERRHRLEADAGRGVTRASGPQSHYDNTPR